MTNEEKMLLIECLLRDIRGNWRELTIRRIQLAKKLCKELVLEAYAIFDDLADRCEYAISAIKYDQFDGRYFRYELPHGYEDIDKIHKFPHPYTLADKSDEFKKYVKEFMTIPESIFEDVKDGPSEDMIPERQKAIINAIDLNQVDIDQLINVYTSVVDCDNCPKEVPCKLHMFGDGSIPLDRVDINDLDKFNTCEDALYLYLTRKEEEKE